METIRIKNNLFVKSGKDFVETLFSPNGTAQGIFKVNRNRKTKQPKGIWLKSGAGKTFAYIKNGPVPFAVNCIRLENGKLWYSFGTDSKTDALIGTDSLREIDEIFKPIFQELTFND